MNTDLKRAAVGIMSAIIFAIPTTDDFEGYDVRESVQLALQLVDHLEDELGVFRGH